MCIRDRYLTTFLLPSGRYRYTCAAMGLLSSGDEWNLQSDNAFIRLLNLLKLIDDLLVQAESQEVCLLHLRDVLQSCRDFGITISLKKLEFGETVSFAGW